MKKLSLFFYQITKLWLAVFLTGLMITYAALVMKSKSECCTVDLSEEQTLPGLRFGYSVDDVNTFFDTLSKDARNCYARLLTVWDSIFPLLYGFMYIAWLSLIYKKAGKNNRPVLFINLYPFLPMCADWLENMTELQLISEYNISSHIRESSAKIASFITQIKWILSSLNYLIILWGLFFFIKKRFQKIKQEK